ncbi:hypothetical protein EFP20_10015 [Burkholderia glumae]|nr:hypothetical protein KS03_4439 [Burkholderia glumae LMG 2196 = ATCC 33617]QKM49595.1 hypothetical protein B7760_03653 [Burkholderia glumae]QKM56256.1 hypothetical protein CG017_04320 [Burkholderia glumae]QTP36594.1 hypothetical protein B7759_05232 [Burkholderia glumae]UVT01940.1 hypothetical protein EFP20_10015 [Burkholderia glumae]
MWCDIPSRSGRPQPCGYNTAAMSRLRPLLARRANHPLLSALMLCVLAFRLILPTGLMLDTSAGGGWPGLVICTGHGPLEATGAAAQAAAALEQALAATPGRAGALDAPHAGLMQGGELCPFSAAFAIAIPFAVLACLRWTRLTIVGRRAAPRMTRPRRPPHHARPGARAPPDYACP